MIHTGYTWRAGFPTKADANDFADQLKQLTAPDGTVNVEEVLDAQRVEGAPLHDDIIWDDIVAAHQFRLSYVQDAMGALRVIPVNLIREEPMPPVRAVLPVHKNGGEYAPGTYRFVVGAIEQNEAELLSVARQEALLQVGKLARRFATIPGCEDIADQLRSIAELL
jgi:hypothetical protein